MARYPHRAVGRAAFGCSILLLSLGCDGSELLKPEDDLTAAAAFASGLQAPSNLSAAAVSPYRINLAWQDKSTNERGFEVHRSTVGPTGPFTLLVRTGANVTSHSNTGLTPSKQYCYKVRAVGGTSTIPKYSAFSSIACATTQVPPNAPTGITATSTNSSTVTVTWTDNSGDETGFRVQRAENASGPWVAAVTTGPNQTSWVDTGRPSEVRVCYRVAAVKASARSAWSGTTCAVPPAAPTNLQAVASGQTTIELTWSDNSAFEGGYQVQRATAHGGPYTVIAETAANIMSYRDAGVASDQIYWYHLRAQHSGGFSDLAGPIAGIAATTPPTAPTWVSASPMNGWSTDILWRDNATNEAGIRIERSQAGGAWVTIGSGGHSNTGGLRFLQDSERYPIETEICYRITAFNGLGESSVIGCTALPAPPLNLTARVVDGAVELSWTDVSRFEDGFYIVRADGSSMGFYYVYGAVGPNTTTVRDESPDPAWSSYYLRGMKGPEGYSCCSNAVDVYMPSARE